eukprot:CAMPEP_0183354362 /NCGR_PEP_ID=MMETSP0164_2-20130417/37262_1 /TAXON_ID=221442 /ORGANISM="Coccolithus pelagicus ssp braarudi, Strain PLY182g" /LENGTH=599 /DNA_ID=CAMNT_0025527231 /DNA_START=76 /DNA_END=1875 /DNA_ORIENTATION=-
MVHLSPHFSFPCGLIAGATIALCLQWLLSKEKGRLTRYTRSTDFPPRSIGCNKERAAEWYLNEFAAIPMLPHDPTLWTPRETQLLQLTATEYIRERRAGRVSCEQYVRLLVRRVHLYRYMNQWIFSSYARFKLCVEAARALDTMAAKEGIEAIAPLYGLPVPMKGTGAIVDFPSGAGVGVLSGHTPCKDCDIVQRLRAAHAIVFGATNVPEFAASVNTANPASGQTRNPYDHMLSPGGSSGGAASAVTMGLCPLAVSEDTGGSTRIPALFNGLFGFDPARNHYPNGGNPGMSYTRDQVGVLARTMDDLLLYDQAVVVDRSDAESAAAAQTRSGRRIVIGAPQRPFVVDDELRIDAHMRAKYDLAVAALHQSDAFTVTAEEFPPETPFDLIPNSAAFHSFTGQVAQWVHEYLDAPVSIREIVEDIGAAGASHNPAFIHKNQHIAGGETQFRQFLGPKIAEQAARYNHYFDTHGVDLILIPAARSPPPTLAQTAGATVPIEASNGHVCHRDVWAAVYPHNSVCKDLHIPKLAVPTGLSADGRPTGIQLWGRAVPYEEMFDDGASTRQSVAFLHLAARAVQVMHSDTQLRRVAPPLFPAVER